MEIVFGFLLFLLFTSLMAFAVWGTLYLTYVIAGLVLVVVKGVLKDKRLSEALNEDLDPENKDLLALVLSVASVGVAISIGSWTPVEVGIGVGAVIFYLQIWIQTGGTYSLPSRQKKELSNQKPGYIVTNLGKPIGEMSQEERRSAAEKIVQTMLDQAQIQKRTNTD
jgi:hypothetical protein